jgi:UDP-glucose 4-epimerase
LYRKFMLITGHTGFIGQALVKTLADYPLKLMGRRILADQTGEFFQKNLNADEDYAAALQDVSVVIHTAAHNHVMGDMSASTLNAYQSVNVDGTMNLARQAAAAGVHRFIFISSIKVNGESTEPGQSFNAQDASKPADPYGVSKADAENALRQLSSETGMEVVIIRPPLVYGPGVKANFEHMLRIAKMNLPLPLGAINNKRSMVALENLVDLIKTCISHPNAAGNTFLVSDDHDLSTTELLRLMVQAYGKKPRLLPVPMSWLRAVGRLTGRHQVVSRLCGSLQVDIAHTKAVLGWSPPVTVEQSIKSCIMKEDLC